MKYGIIAAGEGSRLAQEGVAVTKPMVTINGETLLDRLVRIFNNNDADEIVVALRTPIHIFNSSTTVVYCTTPSSMHSFYELKPYLETGEPFVLTTVDTVFSEEEFANYIMAFDEAVADGYDGLMAVTDYIDDEKPLYVKVNGNDNVIEGFYDEAVSPYVSAGIYGLCPNALETLERCVTNGESRMRNFQRALVNEGKRLKAWRFSRVIDVDHASDIVKAERMIGRSLCVLRDERFSPGRVEDDRAIMEMVARRVNGRLIREDELLSCSQVARPSMVFSMARTPEALEILKRWEREGTKVINPASGVEMCRKSFWDVMMRQNDMPVPPKKGSGGCWLKRGDMAVTADRGIVYCKDEEELEKAMEDFADRGIVDVVVQAHVKGSQVKFYGVYSKGEELLFRCYPSLAPTLQSSLAVVTERMAKLVGIQVFGGDAVITADSEFYIIDFNDWPSFSRCREEAAKAIVNVKL